MLEPVTSGYYSVDNSLTQTAEHTPFSVKDILRGVDSDVQQSPFETCVRQSSQHFPVNYI